MLARVDALNHRIQIGREDNDTQHVLDALSKTNNEIGVRDAMDAIQGPYAFVYWQVSFPF